MLGNFSKTIDVHREYSEDRSLLKLIAWHRSPSMIIFISILTLMVACQ